jgi:hypothetical protein
VLEQLGICFIKEMNLDAYFIPFTKMSWRRTTDLKVKCKTIKLLGNYMGNLDELGFGDGLVDTKPQA